MYYLYILRTATNRLYIGHTNNLLKRLNYHHRGYGATYMKFDPRSTVVYCEVFTTRAEAMAREKQLKKWSRRKKEALIKGDLHLLKRL